MTDITELESLKARATKVGIAFHPSIGVEALRTKLDDVLGKRADNEAAHSEEEAVKASANALIRIHLTCMNTSKTEWEGEIFTVANAYVSHTKFVPFNVDSWHVPQIMLNMLQARKATYAVKGVLKLRPEFSITILPPLTEEELAKLADDQRRTGRLEDKE